MRCLCLLLLTGCQQLPPPAAQEPAEAQRYLPFCAYDISQPVASQEALDGYFGQVDCVPVEYGDLYQLGFGFGNGDLFRLTLPRAGLALDVPVAPALPAAAFYGEFGNRVCTDWAGEVVVQGDLPHWSVYLDVSCRSLGVRVQGQFWGWPAGTPAL